MNMTTTLNMTMNMTMNMAMNMNIDLLNFLNLSLICVSNCRSKLGSRKSFSVRLGSSSYLSIFKKNLKVFLFGCRLYWGMLLL